MNELISYVRGLVVKLYIYRYIYIVSFGFSTTIFRLGFGSKIAIQIKGEAGLGSRVEVYQLFYFLFFISSLSVDCG